MHAEPGLTTERRKGTRAATTFRKLPTARPGRSEKAATVISKLEPAAVPEVDVVAEGEPLARIRGRLVGRQRDRERRGGRPCGGSAVDRRGRPIRAGRFPP